MKTILIIMAIPVGLAVIAAACLICYIAWLAIWELSRFFKEEKAEAQEAAERMGGEL